MLLVMLLFSLVLFMFFIVLFLMKYRASWNVVAVSVKLFVVVANVEAAYVLAKAATEAAAIID